MTNEKSTYNGKEIDGGEMIIDGDTEVQYTTKESDEDVNNAKKIVTYPAIFHLEETGSYFVEFPDLNGCITQGKTIEEAELMAQDALGLFLLDEVDFPVVSNLELLDLDENSFVMNISQDMFKYKETF